MGSDLLDLADEVIFLADLLLEDRYLCLLLLVPLLELLALPSLRSEAVQCFFGLLQ